MTTFDQLLAPVLPILQQIESERPKHGNEKLTWLEFVRILVFCFSKRCDSIRSLVVELEHAEPGLRLRAVSRSTLSDAFWRFAPQLLQRALAEALAQLPLPELPELQLIGTVSLVDGSEFPLLSGLKWPLPGETAAKVKLHLEFRLNKMVPAQFVVGEASSSERQALLQMVQAGVLYVLDRGYFSYRLCRELVEAQADFVMRIYNHIEMEVVTDLPVSLPMALRHLWTEVSDRRVRCTHVDAPGLELRLVEFTVGTTRYRLLTRRWDLSTFQIILLYAYRWQIELALRYFKHVLEGCEAISTSSNGTANYFAAMFLTSLLHLCLKTESLSREGHTPPERETKTDDRTLPAEAQTSDDVRRPTVSLAAARFMASINQQLAVFWKISKHWLETLAAYLHRPFDARAIASLNKYAFP